MAQEIADSTLLDTWASSGLIVEPDASKIIEGWQLGEQPPHEYMNWLQNTFGSKLNHILKNGVATWNNETEYLAGSSVQHNGNVWLCKATNTNSEPTDVNANWKRIITVESLNTVLDGYVATTGDETIAGVKTFSSNPLNIGIQSTNSNALTKYSAVVKNSGDETIAGVKTFSSSPIVPTPTAGTEVANKDYVDALVSGYPAFSASKASQSFTANVQTKLACDVESYDTTNAYDNVTNFRFTPQKAGKYRVTAQMQSNFINAGANINIYKNGSLFARLQGTIANSFTDTISGSITVDMNGTTDYIEAYGYWSSNNTASSIFQAEYIVGV